MNSIGIPSPQKVLRQFRLVDNIYLLGTFETGLTIYSQQVRALNLVWSMIETLRPEQLERVAIIGGGFGGLTAAAGLLHKGVRHVSIFEKRAALCPLQQGSDARWVHPRIYEWPIEGSQVPSAALPLLNWSAGRASDVVVQVLDEWEKTLRFLKSEKTNTSSVPDVAVYLNVKHLRLDQNLEIEWVGEKSSGGPRPTATGDKSKFNSVVLAVGFGLERNTPYSYWRNETLGQPELNLGRRTYLVSGHGDGALVDLFRIRISRFRQDRILRDLFGNNSKLITALRQLKQRLDSKKASAKKLYDRFQAIAGDSTMQFTDLLRDLRKRLRADTAAILQMDPKIDSFEKVFESRASFQNRFLLFALNRAGGVIPTRTESVKKICKEYGINKSDVIRRHGTKRVAAVEDVMEKSLSRLAKKRIHVLEEKSRQPSSICWDGGYWHHKSDRLSGAPFGDDATKARWRREYLAPATEIFVTGFVAAVAGYLESSTPVNSDFRVTLHRTLFVDSEMVLQ